MLKILRLALLTGVLSLFFGSAAFAYNATVVDRTFDFKKPVSVYVEPHVNYSDEANLAYADQMRVSEIIAESQKKLKKFKLAPSAASADLIISTDIIHWDSRRYYIPGHSYVSYDRHLDYETKDGKKAYTETPHKEVEPGRYASTNFFTVRYTVYDKNNNAVYIYMDNRDDGKETINMFERAAKKFFTDFNKMKK